MDQNQIGLLVKDHNENKKTCCRAKIDKVNRTDLINMKSIIHNQAQKDRYRPKQVPIRRELF